LLRNVMAMSATTASVLVDIATNVRIIINPARERSETIMTFRRSYRSAIAPPSGSKTMKGSSRMTPETATHAGEPVTSRM
jgi:hypothetical protein